MHLIVNWELRREKSCGGFHVDFITRLVLVQVDFISCSNSTPPLARTCQGAPLLIPHVFPQIFLTENCERKSCNQLVKLLQLWKDAFTPLKTTAVSLSFLVSLSWHLHPPPSSSSPPSSPSSSSSSSSSSPDRDPGARRGKWASSVCGLCHQVGEILL